MAYNKAKAERKWRLWKEAEEQELRHLGVSEDTIEKLRIHDWSVFNSDRRFYEKLHHGDADIHEVARNDILTEIKTTQDFLDSIEDESLHRTLLTVDRLTLQIALWKIEGYSSREISKKCGLSVNAVNFRMWHLRTKLRKFK
jgi:RNA polymerase sigma-70 factor (ECF subfamily)